MAARNEELLPEFCPSCAEPTELRLGFLAALAFCPRCEQVVGREEGHGEITD